MTRDSELIRQLQEQIESLRFEKACLWWLLAIVVGVGLVLPVLP